MSYPFQVTGPVTGSISSGSYFNDSDNALFYRNPVRDFWFGFSPYDITEVAAYDYANNQLAWGIMDQVTDYKKLTFSYENEKNQVVQYSYNQFVSNTLLYKNDKALDHLTRHLTQLGLGNGDYRVVYNYTRQLAGGPDNFLSLRDISASRKELKIVPTTAETVRFQAFCKKKFQIKDVSALLIQLTDNCPYDELYRGMKDSYQDAINFLQTIFFLQTDGDILRFLKNLYEDYVKYVAMSVENINAGESPGRVSRIQGIRNYFQNWLRSNNDAISDFADIEVKFIEFVTKRINEQFLPYQNQTGADFVRAKQFIYDLFVERFYQTTTEPLVSNYRNKYVSYLKNALNFGNNRYVLILNHSFSEENGELVLLIKLAEELPSDIKLRDRCWISNLGMVPYIFQVSVRGSVSNKTIHISPPDFLLHANNVDTKNINKLYSAAELKQDSTSQADNIFIQKKITELNVDYSNFENFVVFSSVANRLSVFKNKIIDWSTLSASLADVQSHSSSVYPYYTEEVDEIETQMSSLVESFDGYESYLFRSNNYLYNVGAQTWNSSSYVIALDAEAVTYDRNNGDSLINNTPAYVVDDEANDEYLTFLSMIGHYFDNLYLYIKAMPLERVAQNQISGSMSSNMLKDMLGSFGWKIDDILGDSPQDKVYLNNASGGSNALSDSERMRSIWNRILITLPQLYKTKGTEECVRLILACHGIPSDLISVKEYGGVDYSAGTSISYVQNEKVFMMRFTPSYAYWNIPFPHQTKTIEFKLAFSDASLYEFEDDIPLMCYIPGPFTGGSGQWRLGVRKGRGEFDGSIYFQIHQTGSYHNVSGSSTAALELTSSTLPLFNGDVFSVMLRRNWPTILFATGSGLLEDSLPTKYDLYVQRNESGRMVFQATSSIVLSRDYNQGFSDISKPVGNRLLIGNWASNYPVLGNAFIGVLDKIRLWRIPIGDSDFQDHVNDFNSYSWYSSSADDLLQKNLYFVSDVNYPIDVAEPNYVTGSASGSHGVVYFPNSNEYFTAPTSWTSFDSIYTGSIFSSSLSQSAWVPYNDTDFRSGSYVLFFNGIWQNISHSLSGDGCYQTTHSVYPYQYLPVNLNQTYTVGAYGPNKFKNNKIKKTDYTLDVRLDDRYSSTTPTETLVSSDSNIFGFFSDPQDFRNKDIVRYFGNSGILNSISDPGALYSSSYSGLTSAQKQYAKHVNKKTLFTELISLNKFYFDKSIFKTIKNVAPARANTLTGILIEPSIIERPKYQHRAITTELNPAGDYLGVIDKIENPACDVLWSEFNTDITTQSTPKAYPLDYYLFLAQKNQNPGLTEPTWYPVLKERGEILSYQGFEYLLDDYNRITWNNSLPPNYTAPIDLKAVSNPNSIYPNNYGGWYMDDLLDKYQFGWYPDRAGEYRNDSVVGNGKNPPGATSQANMNNCPSGSALYYLLKRWRKYDVFAKSGSYLHTNNPQDNQYSTSSVYLYDIIHVTEDFYRSLVYIKNDQTEVEPLDPSTVYQSGYGYKHSAGTFISTSNEYRSNIRAVPVGGGGPTNLNYYLDNSNLGYYELLNGYPRNHYTNKIQWLSPTRISIFTTTATGSSFIKGRQTVETTVDTGSLGDNSLPVTSINVSNVNVVAGDNVLN